MFKAFQTNEPSQICETRTHLLRQTGLTNSNFRETESYILEKIKKSPTNKLDKDVQGFSN